MATQRIRRTYFLKGILRREHQEALANISSPFKEEILTLALPVLYTPVLTEAHYTKFAGACLPPQAGLRFLPTAIHHKHILS